MARSYSNPLSSGLTQLGGRQATRSALRSKGSEYLPSADTIPSHLRVLLFFLVLIVLVTYCFTYLTILQNTFSLFKLLVVVSLSWLELDLHIMINLSSSMRYDITTD